jgi:LAS superfamily LD-carboxypeptidase LdcB
MSKNKTIILTLILFILVFVIAFLVFSKDNNSQKDEPIQSEQTKELEIEIGLEDQVIYEGIATVPIESNKELRTEDLERFNLILVEQIGNKFYYILEIGNIGFGIANTKFKLLDNDNQEEEFTIKIERRSYNLPSGVERIEPWPESKYIIDGNDLLAPVSKSGKLLANYIPGDLVDLNKDYLLYTNVTGIMLRKEAAENLRDMLNKLKEDTGKNVVIASGYRSYENQVQTYSGWVRQLGQLEADKVSARPGFSEHQLGTAVDFFSEDSGFDFTAEFDNSISGKWLLENSHKYGFIQTYPVGKEAQTGYSYEAWHYRYIGAENAGELRESGVTLNEWL